MKYNIIKLNSARNCFRCIIKAFNIKEIYIPYYICPVIRNVAYVEGCKINFYHINKQFYPIGDFPLSAFVLYPNYFGVCSGIVKELSLKYENLIVDNAHSFFSEPLGIAAFNSVRKFFPSIRNGAFLYTSKTIEAVFPKDDFFYENKTLTDEEFLKNEYFVDEQQIMLMSDYSFEYFSKLNLFNEKMKIREKFNKFSNLFSSINELNITLMDEDIPYKYPLFISDEKFLNDVLNYLHIQNIYPLRLWQKLPSSYPEKYFTNLLLI